MDCFKKGAKHVLIPSEYYVNIFFCTSKSDVHNSTVIKEKLIFELRKFLLYTSIRPATLFKQITKYNNTCLSDIMSLPSFIYNS